MRLHRLVLEDFRGVRHRELVLPDAGVVVLEGANEIGKTSMLEALDMLLTEKHSSRKASVLATKPVHRDAPAQVEAEMTSGPYRFTYRKQWHSRPATTLTVHAPRPEQLTGDEAHQRVAAILGETLDAGLWDALRLLQGAPLDSSALSGSSALSAALDAAAGEAAAGGADSPDGAETLLEAAAARAAEFWTPGGRPTGRLRTTTEAVAAARAAADAARVDLEAIAADADRHARLVDTRDAAAQACAGVEEALAALQEEVAALAAVRERAETARARFGLVDRAARDAAAALTTRRRDAEDARLRTGRLVAADARLQELRSARDEALRQVQEAEEAALTAAAAADGARAAAARARDHVRFVEDVAALARSRRRLTDLEAAITAAQQAGAAVAGLTVDATALRRVEEADAAVRLATARVETAAAHVVVEATAVEVVLDGRSVPAGGRAELTATRPVEVDVAGFAVVRIVPGAETGVFGDALDAARARLDAELATAGCDDLTAARAAHERRRAAEQAVGLALQRLDHLSADGGVDVLRDRVEGLTAALADHPDAVHPDAVHHQAAGAPAGDAGPQDLQRARAEEAATRRAEEGARAAAVAADARAGAARRRSGTAAHELAGHEAALEVATREAALATERVRAARAERDDDAVEEDALAAGAALDAARADLEAARAALAARDAEATLRRAQAAQAEVTRARTALTAHERDLATLTVRLELVGQEGRQEAFDAAATALDLAERDLDGLTRRAAAARLLRDTLEAHRGVTRRRYVAPFTQRLESLGADVFGDDFRVDLDDDLRIVSRTLGSRTVPYRELSTGAREQLAVLTRLACAALVDPVEGVPVVLDDALGHSDPDRLRRLGAVFARVAPPAQVLLLTPGPGVHSSIPGAVVVRLQEDG